MLRAAAERAGLQLTVDCPPLDRPVFVDPRMWEKVGPQPAVQRGQVHLRRQHRRGPARRGTTAWSLTVADTGIGIPAAELPLVFDRFHRVPGSLARNREGTGIGLALVRELVALHGGSVSVSQRTRRGQHLHRDRPLRQPGRRGRRERPAAPVGGRPRHRRVVGGRRRPPRAAGGAGRRGPDRAGGRRQRRHAHVPDPAALRRSGGCAPAPTARRRWPPSPSSCPTSC